MMRLLPLLALAVVPALAAAPVPRDVPPTFGVGGLLSRADFDKVSFNTVAAPKRDGNRDWPDEDAVREEKRDREDGRKPAAPDKPRPANRYDLAVHMPRTKFRPGEPVHAYFVLRNNRDSVLRLGSRMDLSGAYPELHGGGMVPDVRDRATGKSALQGLAASTNCGGGSLVDVPADGYYCVRGDLNRVAGGLAPGDYEVDWRCGRLASAPVRFTITKDDTAKPEPPAKAARARFFRLTHEPFEGDDDEPRRGLPAGTPFVRDGQLSSLYSGAFESGLAVGPNGVYVPDARAIPAADALVEAVIDWKPYRSGDRVAVTLRAVPPHKQVRFDDLPQLYLQVEGPDRGDWPLEEQEKQAERKLLSDRYVTPLTVEVALPAEWRARLSANDSIRVAVVATAKEVELPLGRDARLKKLEQVKEERTDPDAPPLWGGIVRTPFVDLRLPPPVPWRTDR